MSVKKESEDWLIANRSRAKMFEAASNFCYDRLEPVHYGLSCRPSLQGISDDQDGIRDGTLHRLITEHFDVHTVSKFKEIFASVKDKTTHVLEIGVDRTNTTSSTSIILDNKKNSTVYIGVDIDDKSHLDSIEKNTHTLRTNSSNVKIVNAFLEHHGAQEKGIHFIYIDGWHSLNQVLIEWAYIEKYLAPDGVAVFHDTNYHPGPAVLLECMDPDIFVSKKYFVGDANWGLGEVRYK